jgi:hypothetical protein
LGVVRITVCVRFLSRAASDTWPTTGSPATSVEGHALDSRSDEKDGKAPQILPNQERPGQ